MLIPCDLAKADEPDVHGFGQGLRSPGGGQGGNAATFRSHRLSDGEPQNLANGIPRRSNRNGEPVFAVLSITPRARTIAAVEALCSVLGTSRADVIRYDRRAHVMRARRTVAAVLRAEGWTFQRIGKAIEREWSTVRHMLRPRARKARP